MDEQANVKLIRQCYDAFLPGDVEQLLSMLAADIDWVLPQDGGHVGREPRRAHGPAIDALSGTSSTRGRTL